MQLSKDGATGLLYLGLAGVYGYLSFRLPFGSAAQMGPGFFPLLLTCVLAVLGLVILLRALTVSSAPLFISELRGPVVVCASAILFGLLIRPAGFLVAVGIASAGSSFAGRTFSFRRTLVLTVCIVACCWLVFVLGLGLPFPLVGQWLTER